MVLKVWVVVAVEVVVPVDAVGATEAALIFARVNAPTKPVVGNPTDA